MHGLAADEMGKQKQYQTEDIGVVVVNAYKIIDIAPSSLRYTDGFAFEAIIGFQNI
jgi:hypothetical protein